VNGEIGVINVQFHMGDGFIAAVSEPFVKELLTEYIDNIESMDKEFFDENVFGKILNHVHYGVDILKESEEVNKAVKEIMESIDESGRVLVLIEYRDKPFVYAIHPRALADEIERFLIENPQLGEKLRELFKDILTFNIV